MRILVCLLWLILLSPLSVLASERHALVIGNSAYKILELKNPRNDANDMAAQLKSMGYIIHSGNALFDLDRAAMEQSIDDFAKSLPPGSSAVFYYAGHGIANDADNYLIPIDSNLAMQSQLRQRTIGLRSIIEHLKSYNTDGTNVLLLDACRNNPLTRSFRGVQQGLQKLNGVPRGVFIGYAAESGKIANDNYAGDNGTYTGQLLESMSEKPQLSIEALHKEVADKVYEKTKGTQFPVSEYQIYGTWCFGKCASGKLPIPEVASSNTSTTTQEMKITPAKNYWKIIGGVALGLVAVGLLVYDDDPPPTSTQSGVQLQPPTQ